MPKKLTREEIRRLDKMAECPRCNAWLGQLVTIGVLPPRPADLPKESRSS